MARPMTDPRVSVAFLGGDPIAQPGWLATLLIPFDDDPTMAGTGGATNALRSAEEAL